MLTILVSDQDIREFFENVKKPHKYKNQAMDLLQKFKSKVTGKSKKKPMVPTEDPMKMKITKKNHKDFLENFRKFKKSKGIEENQPVFVTRVELFKPLHDILVARGWYFNKEAINDNEENIENKGKKNYCEKMPFYDFKFTPSLMDINIWKVLPEHILNHVVGKESFSKKKGLSGYLRGAVLNEDHIYKGFLRTGTSILGR